MFKTEQEYDIIVSRHTKSVANSLQVVSASSSNAKLLIFYILLKVANHAMLFKNLDIGYRPQK